MATLRYDLHTHTEYSDGYDMSAMARAADEAGLAGVGFTDHCIPYADPVGRSDRYDFHETYETRREDIRALRDDETLEVAIFDGVEINYDPSEEATIRDFLAEADFEYAIGSVHYAASYDVADPAALEGASDATRRDAVDAYVDWQVGLAESGLVDVLAHVDLFQRSPSLRGLMDEADYRRIAEALADSGTVPEINAGRLDREYAEVHPHPDYLHVFREAGVPFVVGTDSHAPDQLRERVRLLEALLDDLDLEITDRPVARS